AWPAWAATPVIESASLILSHPTARGGGQTLVSLALPEGMDSAQAVADLESLSFTQWAVASNQSAPGGLLSSPPRFEPNDPLFEDQWHHDLMQNPEAWYHAGIGTGVVVAVIDTGVD